MRVPPNQNSGTLALLLFFLKLQPIIRLYALRNFFRQYIYTPEVASNFYLRQAEKLPETITLCIKWYDNTALTIIVCCGKLITTGVSLFSEAPFRFILGFTI